jgi:NADAR domain
MTSLLHVKANLGVSLFSFGLRSSRILKMATSKVPNMDSATIHASKLPVKRAATHIYFFGYEGPDAEVCFQQWFPSPFTDNSLDVSQSFPTSEHYMMFRKAMLFGDEVAAKKILAAKTPGEAKTLGRQAG